MLVYESNKIFRFDVLLTVHLSIILVINTYPANVENMVSS